MKFGVLDADRFSAASQERNSRVEIRFIERDSRRDAGELRIRIPDGVTMRDDGKWLVAEIPYVDRSMTTFVESTPYETEILKSRMEEYLPAMVHLAPAAIQRYCITTNPDGISVNCMCETNDDDDDGYPDGHSEQ